MWNQIGAAKASAVDEIKIFDNNDKATNVLREKEHFVALSSLISSTAGGIGRAIWFHIFFILAFYN